VAPRAFAVFFEHVIHSAALNEEMLEACNCGSVAGRIFYGLNLNSGLLTGGRLHFSKMRVRNYYAHLRAAVATLDFQPAGSR